MKKINKKLLSLVKHPVKLPLGIVKKEEGYWNSKNHFTDFTITGIAYYKETDDDSSANGWVRLTCKRSNGSELEAHIPLTKIRKLHASDYLPGELMYFSISESRFNSFINELVSISLAGIAPQEIMVLGQGFNRIVSTNKMVFAIGDEVINAAEDDLVINKCKYKLKPHYNGKGYLNLIMKTCDSKTFPAVLLLTVLSSYVKHLIEEGTNSEFGFNVYVYGKTGTGKTSIVKFYLDLFNGSANIASLSSEKRAIKQLSQFTDQVIGVDDLNLTSSSRVKYANEAKASEFIQLNQGAGNSIYKDVNAKLNNVAFMTAEYVLKNHSSINRCLLVEIKEAFDHNELTYLQNNQDKYFAFILDFIKWICKDYDRLKAKANNELALHKPDYKVYPEEKFEGAARVLRTKQLLDVTMAMFRLFLKEVLDLDGNSIKKFSDKINTSMEECFADTFAHISTDENDPGRGYVDKLISKILSRQSEDDIVTNDEKEYKRGLKKAKKEKKLPQYIFYYNNGYLFVQNNILISWFKDNMSSELKITKTDVLKQLKYHGLIEIVAGETTGKLDASGKSKRNYYRIQLNRLKAIDQEDQRRIWGEVMNDYYDLKWAGDHRDINCYGTWGGKYVSNDVINGDDKKDILDEGKFNYDDLEECDANQNITNDNTDGCERFMSKRAKKSKKSYKLMI